MKAIQLFTLVFLRSSAVSPHARKACLMSIDESFKSDRMIEFMVSMVKDAGKKVFQILFRMRTYKSDPVKAWLQKNKDKMEVFCLPICSPHLDPQERSNSDLKQAMGKSVPVCTSERLRSAANDHMMRVQRSPERVKTYFQDRSVKYAAAQNFFGLEQQQYGERADIFL
jgi:hypothetical protein